MTRPNQREWMTPIYCDACRKSLYVVVTMLLPMPDREPERSRWIDRAVAEADATFEREHAATCGRTN